MSDEKRRLVITEDDLGSPPSAGVSPPPGSCLSPPPARPRPRPSGRGTAPQALPTRSRCPRGRHRVRPNRDLVFQSPSQSAFLQTTQGRNLVAATAGIVVGWAFCEIAGFGLWATTSSTGADIASGAYVGALGLFFAVIYASWEHILARNLEGIKLAARRSALGGAALGFGSGFVCADRFPPFRPPDL